MNKLVKDYYLTHHGIKGQKWGVRNGPPYPLASSAHSASEKKAGWKSSLDKRKKKTYYRTGKERIDLPRSAKGLDSVSDILQSDRRNGLPLKKAPGTIESDMAAANPNYRTVDGYQRNCMYCSTVYDLRRRGYDVTANKKEAGGYVDDILKYYKGSKLEIFEGDREGALAALKSQPEGARGNLMGWGLFAGGHSLAYEIVNGNPRLIDAQTNEEWTWDDFSTYHGIDMYVVRTDNCEPNWDEILTAIDPECLK